MSSDTYAPGQVLQFLKQSGLTSKEKGDINGLFNKSKRVQPELIQTECNSVEVEVKAPGSLRKKTREKFKEQKKQGSRTIFVGNIPLETTKKELLNVFKKCGKIESLRFRSVPVNSLKLPKIVSIVKKDFNEKRSTQNAYIVFEDEASIQDALKLNSMEFKKVHLRVDQSTKNKKHKQRNSIFLGNLPYDAEEESLRKYFEVCGKIENVRIIRDPKTSLGKGIGYISFEDPSSVLIALKLNGKTFMDRDLRIERSIKKKKAVSLANKKSSKKPKHRAPKIKKEKAEINKGTQKRKAIAGKLQSARPTKQGPHKRNKGIIKKKK